MSRDAKSIIRGRFAKVGAIVLCASIFAVSAVGCAGNDSGKVSSSATTAVADTAVVETTESTTIAATETTATATTVSADVSTVKATDKAVVHTTKKVVATTKKKVVTTKAKITAKSTTKAKVTAKPTTKAKTTAKVNTAGAYNSALSQGVFNIVNERRADNGKSTIKYNSKAQAAADLRAKELATKFSHTRPDGRDCFTVYKEFKIGSGYMSAENIAQGQSTAADVMKAWMNSSGHKANILSDATSMAVGVYKANQGYYWVQIFFND